jgi:hypothetical protein
MTVGSVAGHMFLVVRRVDQHLDEWDTKMEHAPAMAGGLPRAAYSWIRVDQADDLGRADHRVVRSDGDLDVLRSLTRAERTPPSAHHVY